MRSGQRQRRAARRGFTLVELLVVVGMVGVLAALALVGYRRYMASAGTAEPKAVIQGIRGGQESYRAEMLEYLNVSQGSLDQSHWYPGGTLGDMKRAWDDTGHPDYTNWRMLNVTTDGAVRFGYASVAGIGNGFTVTPNSGFTWGGLSQAPLSDPQFLPRGPWYVIQAVGDRDMDGTYALLLTTSTMSGIYWENDTE
ncbi:prepilin-type N-terminal cleavage/methylation domain-containing protein [Sorangium sp. So ce176]|uniref:prepilin-type N-terminal cleavage/methylation domain-containing protein n=1 Tax=Sorangium sp. So ce176 TaxID=3133286 RepID=UPI003F638786